MPLTHGRTDTTTTAGQAKVIAKLALALLLSWLPAGCADDGPATFPGDLASALDELVARRFPKVNAPGLAITVVMPNGVTWVGTAGQAQRSPERPVGAADTFRIASVTKTFNAAVLLQLVDEGVVNLDDALDRWVPGFDLGPEVTLRRLLNHTSGVFNYTDDNAFVAQPATGPAGVIEFALDHGPVFAPGRDWSYSNTGFFLTGLAIEAADGRPFHEAVRQRLLSPVGLTLTYMADHEDPRGTAVAGYVGGVPERQFAPDFDMSWAWAAGGMRSNGTELCTWLHALLRPDNEAHAVLSATMRTAMQTPARLDDGTAVGYGLGLDLDDRGGRAVVGHTGSTIGSGVEVFVDVATGACVAVLANDFFAEPTLLSEPVWELLGAVLGS